MTTAKIFSGGSELLEIQIPTCCRTLRESCVVVVVVHTASSKLTWRVCRFSVPEAANNIGRSEVLSPAGVNASIDFSIDFFGFQIRQIVRRASA